VAAEIGPAATVAPVDVTAAGQVQHLAQDLEQRLGTVDMLVNCAGEAFIATLDNTAEADWDRLLAVNLKGPFLMIRALLPLLRRSPNASIVNMVSKVALKAYQPVAAYSAAKAGLLGLTRSLAEELRSEEIRVVALCPGPVDTPMRWAATPDYDRKLVIASETVADLVWHVVNLPRGVTVGDVLIQSVHYD
jgi:NAD(P)-dependent dehydrogenase (short-subunit alcohol dehydrogenase family)